MDDENRNRKRQNANYKMDQDDENMKRQNK